MASSAQQRGLGKGLSALMGEEYGNTPQSVTISPTSTARAGLNELPIDHVHSGEFQPRMRFDDVYLHELADSIEKNGVMQPIIVRPSTQQDGHYEIIAGERRWRASKLAKVGSIPAIIRDIDDQLALELALVENIQRQDLTVLEEALGYQRLIDEFAYTQEELAHTVGKSRSHITNLLRLLGLPDSIKQHLETGALTMGHARALLNHPKAEEYAAMLVKDELTVRQAESLAKHGSIEPPAADAGEEKAAAHTDKSPVSRGRRSSRGRSGEKDADLMALEESLSDSLGLKVSIEDQSDSSGEVVLSYQNLSQLDEIIRKLGSGF